MPIEEFEGKRPRIDAEAFVHATATLIGDVEIGPGSSVWPGASLRADLGAIRIGRSTSVQDHCVLHMDRGESVVIGDQVTLGHASVVHCARVGNGTLVGMNATLLSGAVIGAGSLVAGGAVVRERDVIPDGSLVAGVPAKVLRALTKEQQDGLLRHAEDYADLGRRHAKGARRVA